MFGMVPMALTMPSVLPEFKPENLGRGILAQLEACKKLERLLRERGVVSNLQRSSLNIENEDAIFRMSSGKLLFKVRDNFYVWEPGNPSLEGNLIPYKHSVDDIVELPGGMVITSSHSEGCLRKWDLSQKTSRPLTIRGERPTKLVSISPEVVAVLFDYKTIVVINFRDLSYSEIKLNSNVNSIVKVSGSCLAILKDCSREVIVWDFKERTTITRPFAGHTNWVTSVAVTVGGEYLITGCLGGVVNVWSLQTGALKKRLTFPGKIFSIVADSDSSIVVSYEEKVADVEKEPGIKAYYIRTDFLFGFSPVSLNPLEHRFLVALKDGVVASVQNEKKLVVWNMVKSAAIAIRSFYKIKSIRKCDENKIIIVGRETKAESGSKVFVWDYTKPSSLEEVCFCSSNPHCTINNPICLMHILLKQEQLTDSEKEAIKSVVTRSDGSVKNWIRTLPLEDYQDLAANVLGVTIRRNSRTRSLE